MEWITDVGVEVIQDFDRHMVRMTVRQMPVPPDTKLAGSIPRIYFLFHITQSESASLTPPVIIYYKVVNQIRTIIYLNTNPSHFFSSRITLRPTNTYKKFSICNSISIIIYMKQLWILCEYPLFLSTQTPALLPAVV